MAIASSLYTFWFMKRFMGMLYVRIAEEPVHPWFSTRREHQNNHGAFQRPVAQAPELDSESGKGDGASGLHMVTNGTQKIDANR